MTVNAEKSQNFKKVWYVDEIFKTNGLVFTMNYGQGKQPGEMPPENVN